MSHNGWSSRESWSLFLWLSSYESLYMAARSVCARKSLHKAEEDLKEWVEDVLWYQLTLTEDGRTMIKDVGSLWRIDWREVAKALREE